MPKTEAPAPQQTFTTITFTDGRVEKYETATPKMIYETSRLGVIENDVEAGFFMLWLAAGKPGLEGPLAIDNARPALEAWLDTVKSVDAAEVTVSDPPTKQRERSRGSAA